jgi:hypothetical protein
VTIYSRRGYDWTEQFAPIAKAASELKVREAIIDGEVTVLGKTGFPTSRLCGANSGIVNLRGFSTTPSICSTSTAVICGAPHS